MWSGGAGGGAGGGARGAASAADDGDDGAAPAAAAAAAANVWVLWVCREDGDPFDVACWRCVTELHVPALGVAAHAASGIDHALQNGSLSLRFGDSGGTPAGAGTAPCFGLNVLPLDGAAARARYAPPPCSGDGSDGGDSGSAPHLAVELPAFPAPVCVWAQLPLPPHAVDALRRLARLTCRTAAPPPPAGAEDASAPLASQSDADAVLEVLEAARSHRAAAL